MPISIAGILGFFYVDLSPMPEFIDPVFAKTSPKRSFSIIENERFGLVVAKTGSINSGTVLYTSAV
jgi:hypothetical protein